MLDLFNELDREVPIVALCVLKGGFQYFNDVLEFLKRYSASQHTKAVQFNIDFIRLKSYTGKLPTRVIFKKILFFLDDRAGEEVQVIGSDNLQNLSGKQVIVIEDIVDTGNTMRKLMNVLVKYDPKSVKGLFYHEFLIRFFIRIEAFEKIISVVSMLSKRTPLNTTGYLPDFAAFNVPEVFSVGYALDYNEYFRDLPHICVLNEEGKVRFAEANLASGDS